MLSTVLEGFDRMDDTSAKAKRLEELLHALEDECMRIGASQLEVPCIMLLLSKAIDRVREVKMSCEAQLAKRSEENARAKGVPINNDDKKDWLSSTKLWFSDADLVIHQIINLESDDEQEVSNASTGKVDSVQVPQNINESTVPMNLDQKRSNPSVCAGLSLSMAPMISQGPPMKQSVIWDHNLHRKFVFTIETLGGPMAATPKQIWRCLQVPELTEAEIKTHLHKFRIGLGCFARGRSPLTPFPYQGRTEEMIKVSQRITPSGTSQTSFSIGESSSGPMTGGAAAAANNANGGLEFLR